jgi:hypothetical protein
VACLLTFVVYFVAIAAGFTDESLQYFAAFPPQTTDPWTLKWLLWFPEQIASHLGDGKPYEALKILIRVVGEGVLFVTPSFSDYNPVPLLADGQFLPMAMLRDALLMITLVSTGAMFLLGWAIFSRRELAKVTV